MTPRQIHIVSLIIVVSGAITTSAAGISTQGLPPWATALMLGTLALAQFVNHLGHAIWPVLTAESVSETLVPAAAVAMARNAPAPPFNPPISSQPPVAGPLNTKP